MKFKIKKEIILESLINVTKAISTKSIIPILQGIKVELNKEGLALTASDTDLTIKTFISNKDITNIEKEGIIIVQSKFIVDIIRKMPNGDICFEVLDGFKIKISTDTLEYNLNCFDPNDYPAINLEENKDPIIIKSNTLKEIINETIFAISEQELRPLLTGINLKITGDMLECIATDSYRLAKKNIKLPVAVKNNINIVIPGKNIMELNKIIVEDKDIIMHIFNNKILFKYDNLIFQSNLLSGTYPNTSNLIPNEFQMILNVNLNQFYAAIDRAALLTDSKDKNVIKMHIEGNKLIVSSIASEIGKVEEEMNVENNIKDALDISFSARYMLEALKTFNNEQIFILLNGEVKPIVLKSTDDESLIQLILPIKTY